MKKKDHSIRNGLIVLIIWSGFSAIFKPLGNFSIAVITWIWGFFLALYAHLVSTASVPLWLVYAAAFTLLFILLKKIKHMGEGIVDQNPYTYTTDLFHGVRWRWRLNQKGSPYDIAVFCPKCDMQLQPDSGQFGISTLFYCDKCDVAFEGIHMPFRELENWILREIQRKLRTGDWKQSLNNQSDKENL